MKNKTVRLIIFGMYLIFVHSSFADGCLTDTMPCNLMFYVDSTHYLLPTIENTIHNLSFSSTKKSLFKNIENLNEVKIFGVLQVEMRKIVDYFLGKPMRMGKNDWNDTLMKRFNEHDFFLYIIATPLGTMVEYQFTLFKKETINPTRPSNMIIMPVYNKCFSNSLFIDPTKENSTQKICKAIKSIFPESNAIPNLVINSNCHIYQGKYLSCTNDTVIFDLSNSRDEDTPREELTYFTRQIDTNGLMNFPQDFALSYDPYANRHVFVPHKPGLYAFLFYVNDGISTCEPQKIFLNIIPKPILLLSDHYFCSNEVRSVKDYYHNVHIDSGWIRLLRSNSKPNEWELIVKSIDLDTSNSSEFRRKYLLSQHPEIEISDDSVAALDSIYQYFANSNNLHIDVEPQKQFIKFDLTGRAVPGRRTYNLIARHKTQNIYSKSERVTVDMMDRYYPSIFFGTSYSIIGYSEKGSASYKNYLQLNFAACFYKKLFTEISLCLDNYNRYTMSSSANPIIINM
jgi:hypothetical protein